VLLLTGEPGLGKSRLLDELRQMARARAATLLEGYAFEAEAGRPFGPWIDALRQLPPNVVTSAVGADLAALLPELGREDGAPQSRDRLFAAVLELLDERAAAAPPVVLAIEDVQWLDAASAELLHYVVRSSRHRPLLVALTARAGEVSDNEAVVRALRGLRAAGVLDEIALAPLDRDETRELARAVSDDVDAERVYAESGGNPLLALEVARSLPEREGTLARSISELIRGRVERLPSEAGDVLRWAAVLGSSFAVDRLGPLIALDLDRLLAALELLERLALLRARGKGTYEFAHEVARRAVYSDLSQPRRRLMHLRIAQRLEREQPGETLAAERAHHAALAGESGMAARACAAAGRRFLLSRGEDARHRPRRAPRGRVEGPRTRLLLGCCRSSCRRDGPPTWRPRPGSWRRWPSARSSRAAPSTRAWASISWPTSTGRRATSATPSAR
jgi:predicted ATPase